MAQTRTRPITVALVDDYEVVLMGLANIIDRYRDRVVVAEIDTNEPVDDQVDIVLYDCFAQPESDHEHIQVLIENPRARRVVVATNQASALSIWSISVPCQRAHTSCTTSSASASEPSMRYAAPSMRGCSRLKIWIASSMRAPAEAGARIVARDGRPRAEGRVARSSVGR